MLKRGDCFEIPLQDGRFAYCQYIVTNDQLGTLIEVFSHISPRRLQLEEIDRSALLFPPVFVGLKGIMRTGLWRKVGWAEIDKEFSFPTFRSVVASKPGTYDRWWLWSGGEQKFIGRLPKRLRDLEMEVVWGPENLADRIMTGRNPYSDIL